MEPHSGMESYFSATAVRGRLSVQGIGARKHWDPKRLVYWDGSMVEKMIDVQAGDRHIHTTQELQEILKTSKSDDRIIQIWIHQPLEDAVQNLWEQQFTSSEILKQ